MKKFLILSVILGCFAMQSLAYVKVHNFTDYPVWVQISGAFVGSPRTLQVAPGQKEKTLTGINNCVILNHVKVWVQEDPEADYFFAANHNIMFLTTGGSIFPEPDIDKKIYLDRCMRHMYISTRPVEGKLIYDYTDRAD
jgi:hypothetical protein